MMNDTKKYFINILSSFLNNKSPATPDHIDWEELYKIANIHSLTAIAANQIMLLPAEKQPPKNILTKFKQQLGYTLISYNNKDKIVSRISSTFENNKIPFIFVKGTCLRELYPIKELRTSGDIDIYVKNKDFAVGRQLLIDLGYNLIIDNTNICEYEIGKELIELHSESDYDNIYFCNIFEHADKITPYEYRLNLEEHLLFVLMHIAKHMGSYGAGVRMFMDIDVIIRKIDNFNYDKFIKKCEENNISVLAKTAFSLCNLWFNTPVKSEHNFYTDSNFNTSFISTVIDGGSFGYQTRNTGDYYISNNISSNGEINFTTKVKAILQMFFPKKELLQNQFKYYKKHPVLLPIAWIHKIINGICKNSKHSWSTINRIAKADSSAADYAELIKELEL